MLPDGGIWWDMLCTAIAGNTVAKVHCHALGLVKGHGRGG